MMRNLEYGGRQGCTVRHKRLLGGCAGVTRESTLKSP